MIKTLNWIVENYDDSAQITALEQEVIKQGYFLHTINKKNCFSHSHINLSNDWVIYHGSIETSILIKEKLYNCRPVLFRNTDSFDCSSFWPAYHEFLLNKDFEIIILAQLKENKFEYYRRFGKEASIFVRPDSGLKLFKGGLLDLADFDRFFANKMSSIAKDTDNVVISSPKNINGEFRFVVTNDGEIVTSSTYFYQGLITVIPSVPAAATKFVENLLQKSKFPAKVFVVDVAEDKFGNYFILEFNSFNTSGLYAGNISKIVEKVSQKIF